VPYCGFRVIDEVINAADIARVVAILHSECRASTLRRSRISVRG
jgi:hypothetical protein